MARNSKLRKADRAKYDEFYTRLSDIEDEMRYYKEQFKGKTVLCNCDDPYKSNFFKYFAGNFNYLGLKKLIATSYDNSPTVNTRLSFTDNDKTAPNNDRRACKIEITEVDDYNGDGAADLSDVEYLLKKKKYFFVIKRQRRLSFGRMYGAFKASGYSGNQSAVFRFQGVRFVDNGL